MSTMLINADTDRAGAGHPGTPIRGHQVVIVSELFICTLIDC